MNLRGELNKVVVGAIDLVNRNPWSNQRVVLQRRSWFAADDVWTSHSHHFLDDAHFKRSYARAVRACGGIDYNIPWRLHTILWAAGRAAQLQGAFVECGTGKGFMASAICEYLGWTNRDFYLFDTFKATTVDPATGMQSDDGERLHYYAEGDASVRANFAEWPGVKLVVGRIPKTLSTVKIDKVAFMHLDMNYWEPEEHALRHFWPRLVPGGFVILDDYGFEGCEKQRDTADRVAAELGTAVLVLPTGQGMLVKGA
jgi:SAM-dependent methyltransferase